MEGMFYNISNGYVEGIVRGYRNTLLTGQNYGNLTQCETIDGTSLCGRVLRVANGGRGVD